nr:hypothetical protein F25H10.1 - Caenorhabditis elegans [Caenorhabditis elegans]
MRHSDTMCIRLKYLKSLFFLERDSTTFDQRSAARRASVLGRSAAESLSAQEAASSSERGEHTNSRSPSTSYSSCIDDERKFSSPHRRR